MAEDNGKLAVTMWRAFIYLLAMWFAFFLLFIMQSCTTVRTVTEYRDSVVYVGVHDTLIERYSDTVSIDRGGDTVFKIVIKWREVEKIKHDTISKTQVIKEPYEVTVEKKVVPSWCWWLLAVVVVFVGYKVARLAIKIYTRGGV